MAKPWTDGPRELIQHAVDHLKLGGDADRRFAFISIDNAVELAMKTYLGLPERVRESKGPTRKQVDEASESFPALLSLLEEFAVLEIVGINLGDIEWYHRLRNQLYHSGNGITVDKSKVEAYLQLSLTLFENLFGEQIEVASAGAAQTKTGQFLAAWNQFERELLKARPPKEGQRAYYWKSEFLDDLDPKLRAIYDSTGVFRNELVHGLTTPDADVIDRYLRETNVLLEGLRKRGAQ